jgi:hypothetical protein
LAIVFDLLLLTSSVVLAQEVTSSDAVTTATPTVNARERLSNLTPKQRVRRWNNLNPQQKRRVWNNLNPEQRQNFRRH